MINRSALLADLKRLVTTVQDDLRIRASSADVPDVGSRLADEYARAQAARRTAATFEAWREGEITQIAVAWILSCVFARFLEDNFLIDAARIAGATQERLEDARDARLAFFRAHATETDREYLLDLFDGLAKLPGTADIFGAVNPIRALPTWLSPEAATSLVTFFQTIDPATGHLTHDFSDPRWDTRFLGDLYQDLSEAARKRYALLQTPDFVEKFLLDRTLEPALDEFASEFKSGTFKMIDPACGSGHLVIGSFKRIFERLLRAEPAASRRELVIRSLACVHGIDINPFAAAIARFRLLLAAMQAADIKRLADAPAFALQIACGDSLLHATMIKDASATQTGLAMAGLDEAAAPAKKGRGGKAAKPKAAAEDDACDHVYAAENLDVLRRLLARGQYHAVVANPPYIRPQDKVLTDRYKKRFAYCFKKYVLTVPFMEQIFKLAVIGGFTGQITGNNFMKREFGKKLIEEFFPSVDLTHVIDTDKAFLPGHATGTVIVLGRRRPPTLPTTRLATGLKKEEPAPAVPSEGKVWNALLAQVDIADSASEWLAVADVHKSSLYVHPWSIGGGGASDLKELLEENTEHVLGQWLEDAGRTTHTGEDDAFCLPPNTALTRGVYGTCVQIVSGEDVRDYSLGIGDVSLFPYDRDGGAPIAVVPSAVMQHFNSYRVGLRQRVDFGNTIEQRGLRWFDHSMFFPRRYRYPLSVAFAEVATHNHFALARGGMVFNRTAPVLLLPLSATEEGYINLLGLLNSSVACFWLRQVCHDKGAGGIGGGISAEQWEHRFAFNATNVTAFPLPTSRPHDITRRIQTLADAQATLAPTEVIRRWTVGASADPPPQFWPTLKRALEEASATWHSNRRLMIALQEELDWQCYKLYGLTADELTYPLDQVPGIDLGQRAFEIVLARQVAAGKTTTTWFERHGSTPITEIPAHWPADYKALVQKRIDRISGQALDANIRLIEQPEYKRRWNTTPYAEQTATALRGWLLDRIESYFDFDGRMNDAGTPTARFPGVKEGEIVSVARIADEARRDPLFQEAGEVYRDDRAFDVLALVSELVTSEAVPALPIERYKPSGLLKRKQWERTWELQRAEDAIDARVNLPDGDPQKLTADEAAREKQKQVGDIPVPPKYAQADFLPGPFWRLRGKLDVPKERFVSFPHVTTADGTALVAWAGSDHLQLAKAVSGLYVDIRDRQGTHDDPRLFPLLAVLVDLLPWLKQYHGAIDPEFGISMADSFASFVATEGQRLGKSISDLAAWTPPPKAKRAKSATAKRRAAADSATPVADDELTIQQAADLLKVSRPFLIEQLEKGVIPHRTVGKRRRVMFADVMNYKHATDQKRLKALEKLSALDQELGFD